MFTMAKIKDGSTYLSHHLAANDYYCEKETVTGLWMGKGAERLGLNGEIHTDDPVFEALRNNRHPETGEKLTPRDGDDRVRFFDFQCSAQKSVSIMAVTMTEYEMVRATRYAGKVYQNEMAYACRRMGYETEAVRDDKGRVTGFEIKGVSPEIRERFSKRRAEVEAGIEDYRQRHGRAPSTAEIHAITVDSRNVKLHEVTTPEVLAAQRKQLTKDEQVALEAIRERAKQREQLRSQERSMLCERDAHDEGEAKDMSCAWWRRLRRTTLTAHKMGRTADRQSQEEFERSERMQLFETTNSPSDSSSIRALGNVLFTLASRSPCSAHPDAANRASISFRDCIFQNEMARLGDTTIATLPPLCLRLHADRNQPRAVRANGEAPFTIGSVEMLC